MNELIEKFLTWKEHSQGCSEATVSKYRGYLERLDRFLLESEQTLLTASRETLEEFCGIHMHREGLSPRARRPLISAVRGFYAWLFRERLLIEDKGAHLEYPKAGRRLPRGMTLQDAEKLLMAPDLDTFIGLRDAAIMTTLLGCGMRVSGLVRLNEGDLLFIDDGGRERLILRVKEKGGNERLIPAPDEVRIMLRAYLGHNEMDRIDRFLDDGDRVLFVSTKNMGVTPDKYHGEARRISPRSVNEMIEKYGERIGIPRDRLFPHAMRHLYGTELAEEGIDVLQIQALLGHRDPKTSQVYVHLATRTLARTVDKANPLRKLRTPVTELARRLRQTRR